MPSSSSAAIADTVGKAVHTVSVQSMLAFLQRAITARNDNDAKIARLELAERRRKIEILGKESFAFDALRGWGEGEVSPDLWDILGKLRQLAGGSHNVATSLVGHHIIPPEQAVQSELFMALNDYAESHRFKLDFGINSKANCAWMPFDPTLGTQIFYAVHHGMHGKAYSNFITNELRLLDERWNKGALAGTIAGDRHFHELRDEMFLLMRNVSLALGPLGYDHAQLAGIAGEDFCFRLRHYFKANGGVPYLSRDDEARSNVRLAADKRTELLNCGITKRIAGDYKAALADRARDRDMAPLPAQPGFRTAFLG